MIRSRSTDGRLHLAVIPQNAVLPLDNGAKIRNFHLFRALAARHRVSLLLTQSPPEPCLEELTDAGMAPVSLPKPRSLFPSPCGSTWGPLRAWPRLTSPFRPTPRSEGGSGGTRTRSTRS